MSATTITVGFTKSDPTTNYYPMSDGYRAGAAQDEVTITVFDFPVEDVMDIAELVFAATNHPFPIAVSGPVAIIFHELRKAQASGADVRELSVGDTVTVGSETVACVEAGWERI